ncbi:DALR anticodon binding domain-containing protein [Toxoplasma gondii MAS]|uniref:DALR anticodon binding domain-containing protein n=3 Tax=Toxoplasma gondii TaxID=5811 RepID=A0A086QX43_TOXGO|nr:DALR anticodon binding domain protein [Toxoplasma gondii p89]KFH17175.1 DALR anticodon binding domain-containing protein [Toxoplasma gondii MAS]PUA92503.1 DALR anticodon binding domain-containing protein [Toxoplasma gondii TgCATBr9]
MYVQLTSRTRWSAVFQQVARMPHHCVLLRSIWKISTCFGSECVSGVRISMVSDFCSGWLGHSTHGRRNFLSRRQPGGVETGVSSRRPLRVTRDSIGMREILPVAVHALTRLS